ncbi:MAG: hypothetical protein IKW50_06475 [Oscillospiraceae bacterium]|nr:hypothetical protein [Oscillospiraceae bacterium]
METDKKKTGYRSRWQEQLQGITEKILNREPFSYDLNGDALYKQYKDRYIQQGRQAMMDTMGQAATLTGGYGNSYAQSVGQQTYQGYLQGLNDQVPALYRLALDRYNSEGDRLRGNLNVMLQQDDVDYGRYRDGIADRDDAYSKLMALMTGYGYRPTPEEMAEAGMTEAQMKAILGIEDSVGGGGFGGYDGDGDGEDKEYDLEGLTGAGKNWLERNAYFHDEKVLGDPMRKFLLERQLDNSGLGRGDKELIAGKYGLKLD